MRTNEMTFCLGSIFWMVKINCFTFVMITICNPCLIWTVLFYERTGTSLNLNDGQRRQRRRRTTNQKKTIKDINMSRWFQLFLMWFGYQKAFLFMEAQQNKKKKTNWMEKGTHTNWNVISLARMLTLVLIQEDGKFHLKSINLLRL